MTRKFPSSVRQCVYLKKTKTLIQRDVCRPVFFAALSTIGKNTSLLSDKPELYSDLTIWTNTFRSLNPRQSTQRTWKKDWDSRTGYAWLCACSLPRTEKVSVHCPPTIHGGLSPGLISHWDESSSKYYRFCLFSKIKVHRCRHLLESVRSSDTLPLKGEPKYSTRIIREKKNSNAWRACLCVFARVLQMLQGGGQREHGLLSICRDLPHGIVAGDMRTELSYFILF